MHWYAEQAERVLRDEINWLHSELHGAEMEARKLRELVDELYPLADYGAMDESELDRAHDLMRELGVGA